MKWSVAGLAIVVAACTGTGAGGGAPGTMASWNASDLALDIGGTEAQGHELDRVRGALRLSDGRLVIANGGSGELRIYDSTGTFLSAAGGQGNGPGEFGSLNSIQRLPGDTIAAIDPQLRRVSWFAPSGRFVRAVTVTYRAERSYTGLDAVLVDGRIVAEANAMGAEYRETDGPVRRVPFAYGVLSVDGARFDTVTVAPGLEMFPGVGREAGQSFPTLHGLQFGKSSVVATDGKQIYVGTNEPEGIRVYQPDGTLVRSIRVAVPAEPVTEAHRQRRMQETLARFDRARVSDAVKAEWRENAKQTRYAEVFPDYERLLIGTDGALWQERARRSEDEGRRFVVYDSTGRAIATVTCPERFRPYQVGPTEITGVWRDPDEVNHVRVYRVRRD